MECQISNLNLTVKIEQTGAELSSIVSKSSGREFVWNADPSVLGSQTKPKECLSRLDIEEQQYEQDGHECLNPELQAFQPPQQRRETYNDDQVT